MAPRPNIVLITDDQHRGDTLGFRGHPCVRTPHLDQLALEGVSFTNSYSTCPVCIPARTSLVTGLEAHEYGCPRFGADYRIDRGREDFLGSRVTAAGYQTCLVGKTHWHTHPTFRAGFESLIGLHRLAGERIARYGTSSDMTGIGGNEFYPVLNHLPPELQSTQWVVNRSLEFLRYRDRTQPFFLWVSLLDPHPPTSTIEPYYSMYDDEDIPDPVFPEWASDDRAPYSIYRSRLAFNAASMSRREMRKMRGVYYGMITYIDHQLGRLFGRLQLDGLWDNTMVVFTSDHGEKLGDFGDLAKSEFLESTARVPFIVKPATASDGERGVETDAPVELADLYSTICDVAGAQTPSDVTTKSFLPILTGAAPKVRDSLYGQINNSYMFHDGRYKYLYFADDGAELAFDVERDRLDLHDLSGDKQLTSALRSRFIERAREIGSDVLDPRGELRNEGRAKPSAREIRRQNPMAWEVSHWSMEYEPRDSHYVRKGTGETPGADPATAKR